MIKREDLENLLNAEPAIEERIFVYMGSYAMVDGTAKLTHNSDESFVYKKYRDIETGDTYTVNKASIKVFERDTKIVFTIVDEYTEEEYEKTYKEIKKVYNEKTKTSSKEDAYKLIKRLTPLK